MEINGIPSPKAATEIARVMPEALKHVKNGAVRAFTEALKNGEAVEENGKFKLHFSFFPEEQTTDGALSAGWKAFVAEMEAAGYKIEHQRSGTYPLYARSATVSWDG